MPQESSVNLQQYSFQKKPIIMSDNLNSASENGSESKTATRRRIIEIHDSDSDNETAKVPVNKKENPQPTSSTKSVAEKELKVKYLIKMFPTVAPFELYEALTENGFMLDVALKHLTRIHKQDVDTDFETWKLKMSYSALLNDSNTKNTNKAVNSEISTKHAATNSESNSIAKPVDADSSSKNNVVADTNHAKRKDRSDIYKSVKRQRIVEDADSDDSTNAKNYTDTRVFDSDEDSDTEISNELTGDKKKVLEFMQTAKPNELQMMASCSKKKVDAILASRPFRDWIDLVQKLQENKNLSTDLLNAAQQVLVTRSNVKQLMRKCSNLSQRLEQAISNDFSIKEQPKLLSANLKLTSYQLVGLNWLSILHKEDVNGILADEMGLGKTVQVISFLAHLKESNLAKNTHLVVVPSSTLENWQNEFEKWCPDLNVLLYYGSTDERRSLRLQFAEGRHKEYDVVLTTYTMVGTSSEEKKMFRVTPMHYVIFDEAHMLKNMNTQRYENLIRIKASKRLLLTGTPLQNNLLELMSLLIFVMPNIFSEKTEDLKNLFQKTSKAKDADNELIPQFEREQIEHAKRIMKPFLLRRLKRDVLQDLPRKDDYMLEVLMAPTQEEQYVNLVASFKEAGNSENSNYNGVAMMSDLRKLSNHPLLLRYHYQYEDLPEIAKRLADDPSYKDTVEQYIIDDLACMSDFEIHTMAKQYKSIEDFSLANNLITTSGKFLFLDKKLNELKSNGHRVLIFSQYVILLDVMEEYLQIREHSYLRLDGSTPVPIRQDLIDEFTNDSSIFIFLLSTKAGGLGINLTAADTVIIHDIDFNPYNDKQAEDRCHRMGQQNPVSVYRLISKGTIEEGMWQLTQEKLKLEKEITSEELENTDVKSVVNLLSSALGIDSEKATNLVSPKKKS